MGIYPQGHLMELIRPQLGRGVLALHGGLGEGASALVAGWPIARQHLKGRESTVFVTIEDEEGDVQLILWPQVFQRHRRRLQSNIIPALVPMPSSHDWR